MPNDHVSAFAPQLADFDPRDYTHCPTSDWKYWNALSEQQGANRTLVQLLTTPANAERLFQAHRRSCVSYQIYPSRAERDTEYWSFNCAFPPERYRSRWGADDAFAMTVFEFFDVDHAGATATVDLLAHVLSAARTDRSVLLQLDADYDTEWWESDAELDPTLDPSGGVVLTYNPAEVDPAYLAEFAGRPAVSVTLPA